MRLINAKELWRQFDERVGAFERYGVLLTTIGVLITIIGLGFAFYSYWQQTYRAAWTAISVASGASVDGGRREALKYLARSGRSLQGAPLKNSVLSYLYLKGADLNRSDMTQADLFGADLRDADLWGGHMRDVNLQFAQLQGANLLYADLRCADLRGASLEKLPHRSRILQSGSTILQEAQLQNSHLEGANLTGSILIYARLEYAELSSYKDIFSPKEGSDCKRDSKGLMELIVGSPRTEPSAEGICDWIRQHRGADQDARIQLPKSFSCPDSEKKPDSPKKPASDLTEADLTGANLTGANLTGSNLTRTILTDANLAGAVGITAEQINAAAHLCNTTLPEGTRSYRDCPEQGQQ